MNSSPVIVIEHLRKNYGPTVAVADVSLTVNRGEVFGILGPNGAGKTTTVEAMMGLTTINGGHLRVLGLDPHRDTAALRECVGVQLQEVRLPARIRVGEAMELYASFYANPANPGELMDALGLTEQRRVAFADLSGGQQQRLSIALALVGNPLIAVLDELTTGLDPHARRATWDLIETVRDRGVTVVLVTHYMEEAQHLCDRLVVINRGRVVAEGRPQDLASRGGGTTYVIQLPTGVDVGRAHAAVDSSTHSVAVLGGDLEVTGGPHELSAALLALADADIAPTGVRMRSLDDAFIDLTSERNASWVQ